MSATILLQTRRFSIRRGEDGDEAFASTGDELAFECNSAAKPEVTMAKGMSLHSGLNHVDPNHYQLR